MNVVVDTSVWSLLFRRRTDSLGTTDQAIVDRLKELIDECRVVMLGPVRQEVLSGIRREEHFKRLRDALRSFDDAPLGTREYEMAAEMFNLCRVRGIQGSHTDFIICAAARSLAAAVFTTDGDFLHYRDHLGIQLLTI
jgi:predicted nucleic acid-binding protein